MIALNKQYLMNNLWYGENSREQNRSLHMEQLAMGAPPATLVMPDMRLVWGLDISHWNGLTDLAKAKMNGCSFVIIKAADGSVRTRWFQENKQRAKDANLPWGAYVWLYPDSKVPLTAQVNLWWDLFKDDYPPVGVHIDFEWTTYAGLPANPNATDLKRALDLFEQKAGRLAEVYTAKGYADTYLTGFTNASRYKWWIANYGVMAPNMPRLLVQENVSWKKWQFTASLDGALAPSQNLELDGNYYNGDHYQFAAEYGTSGDVVMFPFPGVTYASVRRFGSSCHVAVIDLQDKHVHVTNTRGQLKTVSSVAQSRPAEIVINGDGWTDSPIRPLSVAASEGVIYQPEQYDYRYWMDVTRDNQIVFDWQGPSGLSNAVSGTRLIVSDGEWTSATDGRLHPRTACGRTQDGRLVLAVVDGRNDASAGVTLQSLAALMIEFGAQTALELDGGGSSAMWVKDRIVNVPSDGAERPVINHVVITGVNSMTAKYKVTVTWDGGARERSEPTISSVQVRDILPDNSVHYADVDPVPDRDDPTNTNKQWIKLQSGWFIATKYPSSGSIVERARVELLQPEPEPEPEPVLPDLPVTITLGDDVTYIKQTVNVVLKPKLP